MTFRSYKTKSALLCAAALLFSGTFSAAAGSLAGSRTGDEGAASQTGYLLGDANRDGNVTIEDVTCIQRYLAEWPVEDDFSEVAADVSGDGAVKINDVTYIQRWLACIDTPYAIGTFIEVPEETTTTVPPSTQQPTDDDGWSHQIFRP